MGQLQVTSVSARAYPIDLTVAGLKRPDISILSHELLAEVHDMPQKNLAVEMLRKLPTGEIKTRSAQEPG